jgi:hypothetical protein
VWWEVGGMDREIAVIWVGAHGQANARHVPDLTKN